MSAIIVSGLVLGSIYALVAAGLSLVWGALGVFNFAHGVLIMIGAYVAWTVASPDALGRGHLCRPARVGPLYGARRGHSLLVVGAPLDRQARGRIVGDHDDDRGRNLSRKPVSAAVRRPSQGPRPARLGHGRIAGTVIQAQNLLAILLAPVLLGGWRSCSSETRQGLRCAPSPRTATPPC